MSYGEALSLLINIAVGIYFFYFYPRTVRSKLGSGRLPPLFAVMLRILPPIGIALIGITLVYSVLRLSGLL